MCGLQRAACPRLVPTTIPSAQRFMFVSGYRTTVGLISNRAVLCPLYRMSVSAHARRMYVYWKNLGSFLKLQMEQQKETNSETLSCIGMNCPAKERAG